MVKITLFGSTGLIGNEILKLIENDNYFKSINIVSRKHIDINSKKTNLKIIDFSDYTKLSCDTTSNYFIEHLNGFYPDRFYKVLVKVKYNDNQEIIYDNDFEFKIVR